MLLIIDSFTASMQKILSKNNNNNKIFIYTAV